MLSEYPIIDFNYLPIIKYPYHIVDYIAPPRKQKSYFGVCSISREFQVK